MAGKSYYELTVALYKEQNFMVGKTEHFNVFAQVRQDLFGFVDAIAVHPKHGIVAVQACGADFSEHVAKLTGERRENVILWLLGGGRLILTGWRKLKGKLEPRHREFTLTDFEEITPAVAASLGSTYRRAGTGLWLPGTHEFHAK